MVLGAGQSDRGERQRNSDDIEYSNLWRLIVQSRRPSRTCDTFLSHISVRQIQLLVLTSSELHVYAVSSGALKPAEQSITLRSLGQIAPCAGSTYQPPH